MAVKIFFCYAHEDEPYLNKIKAYLRPLQRQGLIDVWYDRDISAGSEWEREISEHLNEAKIILLLVSPDIMNSDYCYSVEMKRALERHDRKEATVIPIILRPIYWQGLLGKLQALPTDAKPVVDRSWHNLDEALYDVSEGIRKVVEELTPKSDIPLPVPPIQALGIERSPSSLNVLKREPGKSQPLKKSEDFSLPMIKLEDFSLLRTLTEHSAWITSIVFSPDGQTFASASDDDTIKLWNLQTGELLYTLTGHLKIFYFGAFSPDGQTLASGSDDGTIKLWNLQTGELICTLIGHSEGIHSVAFSSDGHVLASGGNDRKIKLWNLQAGELLYTLTGHSAAICSLAFSPDRQILASGSDDKMIKIWGKK